MHSATASQRFANEEMQVLGALQDLELELRGRRPPIDDPMQTRASAHDENSTDLRDLTEFAVWIVSTAKPGNGVEQLLDGNADTYWQSDGPQPHLISAQFVFKVSISEVQIYLDFEKDESYTPAEVSVCAGNSFHDLRVIRKVRKLHNPMGWVRIPLGDGADMMDDDSDEDTDDNANPDNLSVDDLVARNVRREQRQRRRERKKKERQASLDDIQRRAEEGVNGRWEALRDRSVTKAHMLQIVIHSNHQNGRDSHVRKVRVLGPSHQVASPTTRFTSPEFQRFQEMR